MRIRAKYSLMTAALIGAVVAAAAVTITLGQRRTLEAQSHERLEALMEGVERLAVESVEGKDELMLVSYLMFLRREHPELAHAAITRRGHTSDIGAPGPGLVYVARTLAAKRPVTYTVTAYPDAANPADNVSLSTAGVTLTVPGSAMVRIDEAKKPEVFAVRLGFFEDKLEAEVARALKPMIEKTAGVACGFMVLGWLGALGLGKLLTAPLTALTAAVGRIEKGELGVSVEVKRQDEVGTLARGVNAMTAHIKELMEFREDLLHTLSHEMNTPLAALKGYLELWQDGKLPEDGEAARVMLAAVLRMEESLGSALGLFKAGADASAPAGVVWIDEVFAEAQALYAPIAQSKGIEIVPSPQTAFVCAPEELVRQIAGNLLSNALKYTPEGGTVRLAIEDREDSVRFQVSDTGRGIRQEDLPHLFTKFYRAGSGERIPGTGLGLSIAAKAAHALGGKIDVESVPGKGTTFTVLIPKQEAS